MIDGDPPDPQPGATPPGIPRPQPRPPAHHRLPAALTCPDPAERVARAALAILPRLPVAGARQLGDEVADVRAQALLALWRAARRRPAGFVDERGRVVETAVAAYMSLALRKSLDECRRQARLTPLEAWHPAGPDSTLAVVMQREAHRELDAHLAGLPAGARAVVHRRCAGWSYRRIAANLALRRNTAVQRYRRAIARIPLELHALLPPAHEQGQ